MEFGIGTSQIAANGLNFSVRRCGEGADLALCLHGFPEANEYWDEQLLLAEMGYRAWAPNQRGYPGSSRPRGQESYAIEQLMGDVAGLIDVARPRRTILLGHDWGGIVAWCFAARRIRPLDALIVINAPHPACFARALRRPGQMLRSSYAGFFQVPYLPERVLSAFRARLIASTILRTCTAPDRFPRGLLERTRNCAAEPGALTAMLNWYRAFVRGGGLRRELQRGFPVIETPTLLLWGEADPFLAKETTAGTDRHVRDLTTAYLPGVSHWVQQDAPEACNAMIRRFVGDHSLDR